MSAREVYADREAARRDRVNVRKQARARKEEVFIKFGGNLDLPRIIARKNEAARKAK